MTDTQSPPASTGTPRADAGAASDAPAPARHFERTTIALVANTAVTGGLGTLFWLVAGRTFDEEQVAAAVAASGLLLLLAFGAQLNLPVALSRYLPEWRTTQRATIAHVYALAAVISALVGVGILAVTGLRDGELFTEGDWLLSVVLAVSLPIWVVFAMQDTVLVAVRRAPWVPVENTLVTVAKFAMLPLVAGLAGGGGILLAWVLPSLVAIPIVSRALFTRFTEPDTEPFTGQQALVSFALRDLPGALLFMFALRIVPTLVLELGTVADGALVGVPWQIITVAALALPILSTSLLAELSQPDTDSDALFRRTVRFVWIGVLPACLLGAALARPVLGIAGEAYADRGDAILVWGIIGLVPAALAECYLAKLRHRGRVSTASSIQAGRAVVLLVVVTALIAGDGTTAIGFAFLAVNLAATVVAALAAAPRPADPQADPEWSGSAPGAHRVLDPGAGTLTEPPPLPEARPVDLEPVPVAATATDAGRPGRTFGLATSLVGVVGTVIGVVSLLRADATDVGRLGLFDALPPTYWLGSALVVISTYLVLGSSRLRIAATDAHVVALVWLLHGAPGIVQPNPRFPVAWLHVGFIEQIALDQTLLPEIDARFSWPGFFAGSAFIQEVAGTDSALWMIRFAPIVFNLLACLAIWVLGRSLGLTTVQRLAAMPIFVVTNWSGQDYFAPQATGFLLYLVVVTVLVARLAAAGPAPDSRLGRLLRIQREPPPPTPSRPTPAVIGVVGLLGALVITHQLTPGFMAVALLLLAVTNLVTLRAMAVVLGLGTLAWLSFGAEAFWTGHLEIITGSVGDVGGIVNDNVNERTAGAISTRRIILGSRLALAFALWATAAVSLLVVRRRGLRRSTLTLACLTAAPFPILIVQPYGGEALIRIFLFALAPTSLLITGWLLRTAVPTLWQRAVLAGALCLVLPVFVLARFGNEEFEQVTPDDLAAATALYDLVSDDSIIFIANPQTIILAERVGEVRFREFRGTDPAEALERIAEFDAENNYVLFTASQEAFEEQTLGRPEGWIEDFAQDLLDTGRFGVLFRRGPSVLLEFRG